MLGMPQGCDAREPCWLTVVTSARLKLSEASQEKVPLPKLFCSSLTSDWPHSSGQPFPSALW